MKMYNSLKKLLCAFLAAALIPSFFSGCQSGVSASPTPVQEAAEPDLSRYLISIEDEPDTVDFQCTSIHYTIAQNVFNRLVSMENDDAGNAMILPELAERWELSPDHRAYTFHLREGVRFSNGSPLTASDV